MRTFTGIQSMRGIAALAVVYGHVVSTRAGMGFDHVAAFDALMILQSGVDIFFVISGFIIAITASSLGLAQGAKGAIEFAVKRFARIYPVYWIVLTAAVISSYWISVGPPEFTANLTLDDILLNTPNNYFVSTAWTLYFEVNFYVAMAVVLLLFPKRVMAVSVCGVLIVALLTFLPAPLKMAVWSSPLTLEFGFGILIAAVTQSAGFTRFGPLCLVGAAIAFAAGAYVQINSQPVSNAMRAATFGVGAALLIYATVAAEARGMKFSRTLQYFGDISYSLYVWHLLILTWLAAAAFKQVPGPLQMTAWLVVIVAVSAASYECFERPILSWIKAARKTFTVFPQRPVSIPQQRPVSAPVP